MLNKQAMGLCDMPAAFCVCDTCLACVLGVCVTLAFGRGTGDARRPLITLSLQLYNYFSGACGDRFYPSASGNVGWERGRHHSKV